MRASSRRRSRRSARAARRRLSLRRHRRIARASRAVGSPVCASSMRQGRKEMLTADAYVVCLGSYTPLLLAPMGVPALVYPAKGYSATMPIVDPDAAPHGQHHRRREEDRVHAPGRPAARRRHGGAVGLQARPEPRALRSADAARGRMVRRRDRCLARRILDGAAPGHAFERSADRQNALSQPLPQHRTRHARLDDGAPDRARRSPTSCRARSPTSRSISSASDDVGTRRRTPRRLRAVDGSGAARSRTDPSFSVRASRTGPPGYRGRSSIARSIIRCVSARIVAVRKWRSHARSRIARRSRTWPTCSYCPNGAATVSARGWSASSSGIQTSRGCVDFSWRRRMRTGSTPASASRRSRIPRAFSNASTRTSTSSGSQARGNAPGRYNWALSAPHSDVLPFTLSLPDCVHCLFGRRCRQRRARSG